MREDLILGTKIQNFLLSALLFMGMAVLLGSLGWLFAGRIGLFTAIGMVGASLILAPTVRAGWTMKVMGAQPLHYDQAPGLHDIVAALAQRAGLARAPRLYYLQSSDLNAFAAGPQRDAGIALTAGLLRYLNHRELVGVLAHELSHLRNNDTFFMNIASIVNRMTRHLSFIGQILLLIYAPMILLGGSSIPLILIVFLIGAPVLSSMLQLALSRTREFRADLSAVELTGDPRGLASALTKLENVRQHPWWGLFWPRNRDRSPSWLQSHPRSEERVRRLLSYEKDPDRIGTGREPYLQQRFKRHHSGDGSDPRRHAGVRFIPLSRRTPRIYYLG